MAGQVLSIPDLIQLCDITSTAPPGKDSQGLCGNSRTVCAGMCHHIVWQKLIKVSEEPAASIFKVISTLKMEAASFLVKCWSMTCHVHTPDGATSFFKFLDSSSSS